MKKIILTLVVMIISIAAFSQSGAGWSKVLKKSNFTDSTFMAKGIKFPDGTIATTGFLSGDSLTVQEVFLFDPDTDTLATKDYVRDNSVNWPDTIASNGKGLATAYDISNLSGGSGIGFADYDSLSTDSAYFNRLSHELHIRHMGWWYYFAPSDSAEIYVPPVEEYGEEILADPGFTSSATWYEFGNSLVDAGVLTITNADESTYVVNSNANSTENGKTYKVEYTINSISGGSITVSIVGDIGTARSSPGTYSEELTATGADYLYINPGVGVTCEIDNISLKEKL